MASDIGFVEYIVEQMEGAGEITFKKMFGEFGLYCNGTIMALICNDQLFLKPTEAGRLIIEDVVEVPPYPGAKSYFLIEAQFDGREWISNLVKETVKELLSVKAKPKRTKITP